MPQVVVPSDTSDQIAELSAAQVKQLKERVAADQAGALYVMQDTGQSQAIWDCLDGTWTKPLPAETVMRQYLRKQNCRCSACRFISMTSESDQVKKHILRVFETAQRHKGAQIEDGVYETGRPYERCTGCSMTFHGRPGLGRAHLQSVLEDVPRHTGAKEQRIQRYALGPTAPLVLAERELGISFPEGERITGPVAEAKRSRRRRSRNRHRGRRMVEHGRSGA